MRGEKESTRKTFAAKLAVSNKERTWITGNRRATGPSNIHAFGALAGFSPVCRGERRVGPCLLRFEDGRESPAVAGSVTEAGTVHKYARHCERPLVGSILSLYCLATQQRPASTLLQVGAIAGELKHCRRQGPSGASHPAKAGTSTRDP